MGPVIFTLFMDEIIKLQRIEISECVFADDVVVVPKSEKEFHEAINVWNEILDKKGININRTK